MKSRPADYFSKSLEKGLRILSLFSEEKPTWRLTEIAKEIGTNKTSTYRFVNTLIQMAFLRQDSQTKLLHIGLRSFAFSQRLTRSYDLKQIIQPFVDDAFSKYDASIDAALFYEDALFIFYRREARQTVIFQLPTLSKDTLHCTALGKAILAWLPEDRVNDFISDLDLTKRTNNTIVKLHKLLEDLERTRERGYSLNNEEYMLGLVSVGAPLINVTTKTSIGSVSFDFLSSQYSVKQAVTKFSGIVKALANDISESIPTDSISQL